MSVSMFILITPYSSVSRMSARSEPDPPWNTRSISASAPCLSMTAACPSRRMVGLSFTEPGLYAPWTFPKVAANMNLPIGASVS